MKKILLLLTLIFVCGCEFKGVDSAPSSSSDGVQMEIDGWLSAKARAAATRTHATGEHPAAQAEMDRHEASLKEMRQRDEGAVEKVFNAYLDQLSREKEEIVQKMNQTQILGRSLTPEEMNFVEEMGPELLREFEARRIEVEELKRRIQ